MENLIIIGGPTTTAMALSKSLRGQFRDILGDQADMAVVIPFFRSLVDSADEVHAVVNPALEVCFEEDVCRRFETGDDSQALAFVHVVGEVVDDAVDRRQAGAACDQDDFLAFEHIDVEAVAIRPAHEEVAADVVFKDFIGQAADLRMVKSRMVGNAADGNGRFTVFRDRDFKELARFDRMFFAAVIGHTEGIFHISMFNDF